nr:hypothetical protein [Candidatus Microthrix sp.]
MVRHPNAATDDDDDEDQEVVVDPDGTATDQRICDAEGHRG